MKKLFLTLLLTFITVAINGCNEDDHVMDTKLIKGQWELVTDNSSAGTYIYNFMTKNENTWSWGTLTTYYLKSDGTITHDKIYDWSVSDPNNDNPVHFDMTLRGEPDDEDAWTNTEYFIVESLSSSEMVLRKDEVGDTRTRLRFIRRNDLAQP